MFDALRKMIFPIIIVTLLFFFGLIILQWGANFTGSRKFSNPNVAAVINGEEISWQVYQRIYNNMYQEAVEQYDGDVPDDKNYELEKKAWEQLLYDRLIMQQAKKFDIIVTDEELYAYLRLSPPQFLQEVPQFQTDGKFDYQKYINAMVDPQFAGFWSSIQPTIENEIIKLKVQEMVIQTAHVTEDEVKDAFMEDQEKIKVGLVNVGQNDFSKDLPQPTEDELQTYFADHREKYKRDARRVLNLVQLKIEPSENDWEKAHAEINMIYDSIMAGADFAEMAKQYSMDASGKDGGDLGWFMKGQMVPKFDSLAFSMKQGEISKPFRTQYGWHIIKHFGYKEEMDTPRGKTKPEKVQKAHASHILIKVSTSPETRDQLYTRLSNFIIDAKKTSFADAAGQYDLEMLTTQPFTKRSNIQYIGYEESVWNFAFDNKVGTISDVMDNGINYFVIQVADALKPGLAEFDEVASNVRTDYRQYVLGNICQDTAEVIYQEIQNGSTITQAAKDHGMEYAESELINRKNYLKDVGYDPEAIGAAFSISELNQIIPPVKYSRGSVILKLLQRVTPDLSDYNALRDSIYTAVRQQKQQDIYGRWFNNLVENADIINNTMRTNAPQASL